MIKRILSAILVFAMLMVFSACENVPEDDKISIVCTTYAAYDWTRAIAGENGDKFEIILLGDGADLHSFQPTAADIARIHTADLFVQIGGMTEEWTNDLNLGETALKLFDTLEDDDKLCPDSEHSHHNHTDSEFDEHIWLSLKLAQPMVNAICDRLCDLDKENGVDYQLNCSKYTEELKLLDEQYKSAVHNSKDKTVIFADRFPFGYMMRDYGIDCFSAFDGCSSDTNASFETIANLSEQVKKYNKDTVLVLENSAESVAAPLKSALQGQSLDFAVMNSCQSIRGNSDAGYIDIMKLNLESLKKALG